jgi:glutathione S-transferase
MRYSNGSFDEILLESGPIAQFLADAHPSHLLPASDSSPTAPLFRYRVNFFVDTYFTKVNTYFYAVIRATNDEEKKTQVDAWVKAIEKEIEPLLHDANPFFGGSKEMTLAEVFPPSTMSLELPLCMLCKHGIDSSSLHPGPDCILHPPPLRLCG